MNRNKYYTKIFYLGESGVGDNTYASYRKIVYRIVNKIIKIISSIIVTIWIGSRLLGLWPPIQDTNYKPYVHSNLFSTRAPIERLQSKPKIQLNSEQSVQNIKLYVSKQNIITSPYIVRMKSPLNNSLLRLRAGSDKFSAGSKALGKSRGQNNVPFGAQAFPMPGPNKLKPQAGIGHFNSHTQSTSALKNPEKISSVKHLSAHPSDSQDPKTSCSNNLARKDVNNNDNSTITIVAHDGRKCKLTDKSNDHITSKHGHSLGINDPLPPADNQKPTKYPQTRTRLNKANKQISAHRIEEILQDPRTERQPNITIRGRAGYGYVSEKEDHQYSQDDLFIGIETEGSMAGKITKCHAISPDQKQELIDHGRID